MKNVEEIYQELLNAFAERTGFTPEAGCDLAVRLWVTAAQIQALGIQADWVLDQSFPQTAVGIYLDRHGAVRGVERLPATKAMGTIRFSAATPPTEMLTIPAGTVCMTSDGTRFQTVESVNMQDGSLTVDALAEAVESGSSGNVATGQVTILTACPISVIGCTNPKPFSGGSDAEDDEPFRKRILESYQRLPNGANAAWYEQTAMSYGGIAEAKAVGRPRGIGTVDVYVATENGLPSAELLAGLQKELQQKREIAVDVKVKVPTVQSVNVSLQVAPAEGVSFERAKNLVEQQITTFFTGHRLGKPVLLAELGSRIYELNEVKNYHISEPATDVKAAETVLPVLGTLRVTEMGA